MARRVAAVAIKSRQPIGHLCDALGIPREWPQLFVELEAAYADPSGACGWEYDDDEMTETVLSVITGDYEE